jgi:predicted GIY-YIG superfamily endonuclease
MYLVYILRSGAKSYVGMTNDFFHRWRQHIGELKGGAKYTTRFGTDWYPILIIDGFQTMREAMQCEWKVKRRKGHHKRVNWVYELLTSHEQWTTKSPKIQDQQLHIYVDREYRDLFQTHDTRELCWI